MVINSRKLFDMTEHRLFRLALCDLKPQFKNMKKTYEADKDFRPFFMPAEEVLELFNENKNNHRTGDNIEKAAQHMVNTSVQIGTPDHFTVFPIFDFISFDITKGLQLKFHDRLKPILLDLLNNSYTKSFLKLSFDLTHPRSLTLLEMILADRWKAKDKIIIKQITTQELRFAFNVKKDAYKGRMDRFRASILNPAIEEINEKTNYHILPDYKIKYGRYKRMESFTFTLILPKNEEDILTYENQESKNQQNDMSDYIPPATTENQDKNQKQIEYNPSLTLPNPSPKEDTQFTDDDKLQIIALQDQGIKVKKAEQLVKEYGNKQVKKAIQTLKYMCEHKTIANPAGFIITTLQQYTPKLSELENENKYKGQEIKTEAQKKIEATQKMIAEKEQAEREELKKQMEEMTPEEKENYTIKKKALADLFLQGQNILSTKYI